MSFDGLTSPLSSAISISSPPTFSPPSPPPQPPPLVDGTRRRSPLSDAEKLDKVFECLRTDVYWSVSDFLRVLTAAEGPVNIRRKTAFAAAAYKDSKVLGLYFDDEDRPWNGVRQSVIQALDLGNNELRNEVQQLGNMAPFSKNPSDHGGSYEKLDMSQVIDTCQKQAPMLLQILRRIIAPELRRLYERQTEPFARLVAILSILCFSQRQNTSTGFQTLLGLYFHSKGVKRRQLELLSQFGLSVSYHTILNIIKKQSEHAAAQVTASGQSDASVTAYDNFEQMEGVKEQRVDHQGAFHSVTTGQVLQGLEIPSGGLRQDMLDPQVTLSATAIFQSPGNQSDVIERQITRYFAYEAISTVFLDTTFRVEHQRPKMPEIDVLIPVKTRHCSLGPIPHDESSNAGNFMVLENIFRQQYRLPDSAFEHRLFLIYGDQKTTQRIRTIRRRRERARQPYNSLRWALPVPALFHLRMNYLYMVSRVHFGGQGGDQSTLYDAMNFWTRKGISKSKSDFYALEQLVIHSFQARVCALVWHRLAQSGLAREFKDVTRMLATLDAEGFLHLLDSIVNSYGNEARSSSDMELRNHVLFLQHVQTYLLLKFAIKHADIGLLRRAVDRCCIYFHGSGQHKYAYEMLYLQRLISTSAASPELQRAILANGLVNPRGMADGWFETDLLVELHNGTLKKIFKDRRGSAITLDYLFEHCALNTEFFASLANHIESLYGIDRNGKRPEKSARIDIMIMAQRLSRTGSIALHTGRGVKYKAADILQLGAMRVAGDALVKFNRTESSSSEYRYTGTDDLVLDEEDNEDEGGVTQFFAMDDIE